MSGCAQMVSVPCPEVDYASGSDSNHLLSGPRNNFRIYFVVLLPWERIFTMISKINKPFVRFKQGFLPVGRHKRKHPFSLRYIELRTLDARFDLFGILAIFLGHWTLIARQNPSMQPKGRRHACVMELSSTYCAEHGCKNLFGYC